MYRRIGRKASHEVDVRLGDVLQRKRRRKLMGTLVLLLAWAGIMAYMSAQPYTDQDLRPMLRGFDLSWVERWLGWMKFTYASSEISVAYRGPAAFLEFFIRKGAHVLVFATLGFLSMRLLTVWSLKMITRAGLALFVVVTVAMIDEYRHFLHPGRSGLIEDVVLDAVGGMIGIGLYWVLYRMKYRG